MINKIKESKFFRSLIFILYLVVYIQGARSLADWVTANIGTSPTSSFYGLVTLVALLGLLPIQRSLIISLEENDEKH